MVFQCLIDKKRVNSFKAAISSTVKAGDVVVDYGAGSGILSFFAADAGAKRVYAIEKDPALYDLLKLSISSLNYSKIIIPIKDDALKVNLPEKADIIICEMIATGLFDELQIPVMNNALKIAQSNCKIILSRIQNFVELVDVDSNFYGKKIKTIQYEYGWAKKPKVKKISEKKIYSEIDFSRINSGDIDTIIALNTKRSGKINAIKITNKTFFSDKSTLTSSPAYCMPIYIPIEQRSVRKGDKLSLHLKYKMCLGIANAHIQLL